MCIRDRVGIHSSAAQDIEVVDENQDDSNREAQQTTPEGEAQPEENQDAPQIGKDEAMNRINDALRNLESARDGSFEEYGRALDQLDRAVAEYQRAQ